MARTHPSASASGKTVAGTPGILKFRNRLFTVMRGVEVGWAGDETDVGVPIYTHVPCALAEVSDETFDRTATTRRTIRTWTCVFDNWVDVTLNDTLQDEASGFFYSIESMEERPGIGMYPPAKILSLTMVSGVTVESGGG
jgi:hypothetical protein